MKNQEVNRDCEKNQFDSLFTAVLELIPRIRTFSDLDEVIYLLLQMEGLPWNAVSQLAARALFFSEGVDEKQQEALLLMKITENVIVHGDVPDSRSLQRWWNGRDIDAMTNKSNYNRELRKKRMCEADCRVESDLCMVRYHHQFLGYGDDLDEKSFYNNYLEAVENATYRDVGGKLVRVCPKSGNIIDAVSGKNVASLNRGHKLRYDDPKQKLNIESWGNNTPNQDRCTLEGTERLFQIDAVEYHTNDCVKRTVERRGRLLPKRWTLQGVEKELFEEFEAKWSSDGCFNIDAYTNNVREVVIALFERLDQRDMQCEGLNDENIACTKKLNHANHDGSRIMSYNMMIGQVSIDRMNSNDIDYTKLENLRCVCLDRCQRNVARGSDGKDFVGEVPMTKAMVDAWSDEIKSRLKNIQTSEQNAEWIRARIVSCRELGQEGLIAGLEAQLSVK